MDYPSGYAFYGSSNNGQQITLRKATSSDAKPKLLILDRKDPVFDPQRQVWSVPEVRARVLYGTTDALGNPTPQRLLFDGVFRMPVTSSADQAEWVADISAIISDVDFIEFLQTRVFPTPT